MTDKTENILRFREKWEDLNISNDFLFGKIMQNPDLCKELLQRILPDLNIGHIEYPELQKTVRHDIDAKSVRLDVYAHDDKGTVYNMEMQIRNTKELPGRTRYYQGMIDLQMLDKGQSYKRLKPSYIIFICLFDPFGRGRHIYTFKNVCQEDPSLPLKDGTHKIFLNTEGRMDDVSLELHTFLDYAAGRKSEDPFTQKLEEALNQAKKNRAWRREYMTLQMRDQENIELGMEIGRQEGMEKGINLGRAEGIEKGKIYGIIAAYKELNLSDHEIIQKLKEKFHLPEEETVKYIADSNS